MPTAGFGITRVYMVNYMVNSIFLIGANAAPNWYPPCYVRYVASPTRVKEVCSQLSQLPMAACMALIKQAAEPLEPHPA